MASGSVVPRVNSEHPSHALGPPHHTDLIREITICVSHQDLVSLDWPVHLAVELLLVVGSCLLTVAPLRSEIDPTDPKLTVQYPVWVMNDQAGNRSFIDRNLRRWDVQAPAPERRVGGPGTHRRCSGEMTSPTSVAAKNLPTYRWPSSN